MRHLVGGPYEKEHFDMFNNTVRAVKTCEQRFLVGPFVLFTY